MGNSLEKVNYSLAMLDLREDIDSLIENHRVSDLSKAKDEGRPIKSDPDLEEKFDESLKQPSISDTKKTILLYERARYKYLVGELNDASACFKIAISSAQSVNSKGKKYTLLRALYYSYSNCLERMGNTEDASRFKKLHEELASSN